MAEAVGWKEEVARCDPLTKRKSSNEASDSGYDIQLSEGGDSWLDSTVGGLPDCNNIASLLKSIVPWQGCGCSRCIVFEDVVPDADPKSAMGGVGHTSPIHVTVRLGHDRGDQAEGLACAGYAIDRESTGFADQGVGIDQVEELVDLLSRQIVRK